MRATLILPLVGLLAVGCSKSSEVSSQASKPSAAPPATAAPAAPTAAATAAATVAPKAADVPAYPAHKVPAGHAADGTWTGPFEVVRVPGHLGLDYVKAMDECIGEGKALCTETQWTRACDADPSLAKIETWAASGSGDGRFVVRGGADGTCGTRSLAAADASVPVRAAVCCDRALGIRTSNKNEAFLKASSKHMLDYERSLRDRDLISLSNAYDDTVKFLGKDYARDALIKLHQRYFKAAPDQWTLFDTCDISIDKQQTEPRLLTDCRTLFHKKGKVYIAMQRFVRGGPLAKIQIIGDVDSLSINGAAPDDPAASGAETKERVGILLLTE